MPAVPRLIVTPRARLGMIHCREFLEGRNPEAAARAGQVIAARLLALQTTPDIGRPFDGEEALRELVIGFGSSGYVALYRHDPADDAVYVLALRHQREAGYS